MATTDDYRYSEQLTRLGRAKALIDQAEAELNECINYERRHHASGLEEYATLRCTVTNALTVVGDFADGVKALAEMQDAAGKE